MKEYKKIIKSAKLLYIDHSTQEEQWHSILHSHPFTEFFYITNGQGKFKINDITFNVKEDDLVIVNPNIMHTELCNPQKRFEYIVLGVDGIFFKDQYNYDGYSFHNFRDYKHEVLFYLKSIHVETIERNKFHDDITNNLFQILLMNILRRNKSKLQASEIVSDQNKDCLFLENYITENFDKDITLDHLSEITFLDKYYLSHLFKQHCGMAPIEFLHDVRIKKAKKLLTTTDFSIAQISLMIGLSNPAYFSHFFKSKTSYSPSQYREKFCL